MFIPNSANAPLRLQDIGIADIVDLNWAMNAPGQCEPLTLISGTSGLPRALVAYLPEALRLPDSDARNAMWSNPGQVRCLVACLLDRGFCVDLIDWRAGAFHLEHEYQLFVGHAGPAFHRADLQMPDSVQRILLATEAYWKVHLENTERRRRELCARRKVAFHADRRPTGDDASLDRADSVIGTGGTWAANTYPGTKPAVFIENAAYADRRWLKTVARRDLGRPRGLIFFGGSGPIHKGLDRVLEATSDGSVELHVCSTMSKEFEAEYEQELHLTWNTYFHGWTAPLSHNLRAMVNHCAFTVLPTCSEGSPGSLCQMLQYGLIPIVTPEASLDLNDLAITLEEPTVDCIRQTIEWAIGRSDVWVTERRNDILRVAQDKYSPAAYYARLQTALTRAGL